jgi:hypothetical protein
MHRVSGSRRFRHAIRFLLGGIARLADRQFGLNERRRAGGCLGRLALDDVVSASVTRPGAVVAGRTPAASVRSADLLGRVVRLTFERIVWRTDFGFCEDKALLRQALNR